MSENLSIFVFHSIQKRWKREQQFLETKTMVIGWAVMVPNLNPFEFLYYLLPSARFDIGSFLRNINASQMRISVNFDLGLHFQGHLLQALDG